MFKGLWNLRSRQTGDPLRAALGHLEREVMEVVWQHGETTVRQVQGSTSMMRCGILTVMTTLDRLFKKGFVARTRRPRVRVMRDARVS